MRAVEELVNAVRDHESRRYLREAVGAYQAGAFRAAIVAAWVAVAFDLIGKIRELAVAGDGGAADFIRTLERAIDGNDRNKLLQIERDLLREARDRFEFIEHREYVELERLHQDRHVCAHPAFVRPSEVFEPTPELVRAHLATAADAVLSKVPTPGKRAMQRFRAEVVQDSFPSALTDLVPYLRDRYFEAGKSSLRRGLAELIVRRCLDADGTDHRAIRRYALSAHALERIEPGLLAEALASVVTKLEQGPGLTDDQFLCFTGNLGDMPLAWQALPGSSHARVYQVLKGVAVQRLVDHRIFSCDLAGDAKDIVETRLADLDSRQLAEVIGQSPELRYVGAAVDALRESATYREAEERMGTLVIPLAAVMTATQIREVLDCIRGNPQMRRATQMPPLMVQFFEKTESAFTDCYADWYDLTDWLAETARDPEDYYAYPELWARVHAPRAADAKQ
jgi:hypothetical protein